MGLEGGPWRLCGLGVSCAVCRPNPPQRRSLCLKAQRASPGPGGGHAAPSARCVPLSLHRPPAGRSLMSQPALAPRGCGRGRGLGCWQGSRAALATGWPAVSGTHVMCRWVWQAQLLKF